MHLYITVSALLMELLSRISRPVLNERVVYDEYKKVNGVKFQWDHGKAEDMNVYFAL